MGTPHSATQQPLVVGLAAPTSLPAEPLYQNCSPSNMINRVIDTVYHKTTPSNVSNEAPRHTHAGHSSNAVSGCGSVDVALGTTEISLAPDSKAAKEKQVTFIRLANLNSKVRTSDYLRQFMTESDTEKPDNLKQDNDVQIVSVTPSPISTNVPTEQGEKELFMCQQCRFSCHIENEMILHMFEHYDFTSLSALSLNSDFNYKDSQYSCVSCSFKTPSRLMFREHVRCHLNPKAYSCAECGTFVSLKKIGSHYKISHEHSIPAICVTPSEILDTLMQRLGPAAPPLFTNVVCKPLHVPDQPGQTDLTSTPNRQGTSESCLTKTKQTNLQFQQRVDVSFSEKEASKTVSFSARDADHPPVPYNVDIVAGNAEYVPARIQPCRNSDGAESGVHDMDLEMGDGENAAAQVSTSTTSHNMPGSRSVAAVKQLEDSQSSQEKYQQATGKPTESIENESAVEGPTKPNHPEEPKPVQVIIVEKYPNQPIKKPPMKKQMLKLLVDFDNGMFTCKSCNVKERDEALFRKHLWQDIHLSGYCTHGGSANSTDGCLILNNLMHLLLPKKGYANGMPVSMKHNSTSTKAAGGPSKVCSQTEVKQKKAKRNQARVKSNMARLKRNLARVERNDRAEIKETRAAARAAKSKLGLATKTTKNDSDDDDFSPDDSNDEDWCNESSMSDEEDEHITAEESAESSDSNSDNSGVEDTNQSVASSKIQQSLKSATSDQLHGSECPLITKTEQCSVSANSEYRGETVNPATSDFNGSLEPTISDKSNSDKNNSTVTPNLQGTSDSVTSKSDRENSLDTQIDEALDSNTSESNDKMNSNAPSDLRETPEHYLSEENDTDTGGSSKPQHDGSLDSIPCRLNDKEKSYATSGSQGTPEKDTSEKNNKEVNGSIKPQYEGTANSATSESNDEKSCTTSELQIFPEPATSEQCDKKKSDSTNPLHDGSANSCISKRNDEKESSANTELKKTSESATSVVTDKMHDPAVPRNSKKAVAESTAVNNDSKGQNKSFSNRTGDDESSEVDSSDSSDDVIILSDESDKTVEQPSKSTNYQQKATSQRGRPSTFSLRKRAMVKSTLTQIKTVPTGTEDAKSADQKTSGKTADKTTKKTDKRASPQKKKDGKKAASANGKPGIDDGDNETDSEEEEEKGQFFKCKLPACGRSYPDVASLKAHIMSSHSSMTLFPCPYCSCLWSDYNRLVEHIPAHSGPKPYRCVQCDVCFEKNSLLRKHLKKSHHVNKKFACTHSGCNFISNIWTEFKVHNLSYHMKENSFACFACGTRFTSLNDYFVHIESGMETLICCSECTMKAKMRHTILRHANSVHPGLSRGVYVQTTVKCAETNESPQPMVTPTRCTIVVPTKKIILHTCSDCDFADENKASFDKHVRSHELLEKLQLAFSCPYCPFGSSDLLQYKMHIANHRSKSSHQLRCFKCIHCPFVTNEMTMIEKHLQEKHKERPFKYEVQQEVVTAKVKRTGVSPGVVQSVSNATSSTPGKIQKSFKSAEAVSSGSALGKDVADQRTTPVTQTKHDKGKRRRRSTRISSDNDDHDDDTYCPVEKSKLGTAPELTIGSTDRSLRRSCRIAKAPKPPKNISTVSLSEEADAGCDIGDDDESIVPPSRPDNDYIGRQHSTSKTAPVEKTPAAATRVFEKSGNVLIDRFHCDSCEFACGDWKEFHDHVQSLHANCTQWSNISMSVTSTVTIETAAGERASTPGDKTTTATDNDAADADSGSVQEEQRYFCNLCNIKCQEWDTFKTHMADAHSYDVIKPDDSNSNIMAVPIERPHMPMQVHRSGQFRCPNCTFSTDSKTNMWRHKKGHSAKLKAGFKCMYCSYQSTQKFVITRHVQNYHPDKPSDQTHVVVLQSRKMPTISLKTSDRRPMTEQKIVGVDRQSNCRYDVAQPEPEQSSELLDDGEFHSDNDDLPDDEDNGAGQTNADCSSYCTRVDSHDLFQCNLCEFMHRFPSKVLRHFNYRHTKHCPYQCGYCDFRSVESGKVKRHCGSAHRGQAPKVIKVDVDAKTSEPFHVLMSGTKDEDVETEDNDEDQDKQDGDNQWYWRRHVKTSGNQMVSCKLCAYRQVGTSALKRHILAIHLGFMPFACKYCAFSTMEIRKVREHIGKTHPDLVCKVIRRKYQGESEREVGSSMHGVKVGHTSNEVDQPDGLQSQLPTARVRTRTGVPAAEGRVLDNTMPFTNTPVPQTVGMTDVYPDTNVTTTTLPTLTTALLNMKSEPDPTLPCRPQNIKFYKCIYCDFCSEESLHNIRDHIFVAHLRRNHFMCSHCQFGSMKRDDVISHSLAEHPDNNQKVDEDRTHTRNISILETHGDVLLVGMLTDNKVPLIELPKNPQEAAPRRSATPVTETLGDGQQTTHAITPSSKRSKPTARKRTSALSKKNNQKKAGKINAAVTNNNQKGDSVIHKCRACNFSSNRMDTVKKHVLCIHLHKPLFGCPYCRKHFSSPRVVRGHIADLHPQKEVRVEYSVTKNRKIIQKFIIRKAAAGERTEVMATAPPVVPESRVPDKKKRGTTSSSAILAEQTKIRSKTGRHATITVGDESDIHSGKGDDGDSRLTKLRSPAVSKDEPASVFIWKCKTCGTKLAKLEAMRYHMLTEHMDLQPYQCAVCNFGERTSDLVEAHIQDIHRHSRIHIPVVDVMAEKGDSLKEKMIRVKMKKTPTPVATTSGSNDLCDHEVRSKSNIICHRQSHSQFRRFGCSYCAYKTSQLFFMRSHINNVHAGRPMKYREFRKGDDDQINADQAETTRETTGLNRSGQSVLGKKAPRRSAEIEKNARVTDYFHAAVKTPDVNKVSISCEAVTPSSEDTDDDQRPMFECLMCGKTMQLKRSVCHHIMNDHLKYTPYKCNYCKTRNANRRGVREHISKYHPGKPCIINYKCNKNMDALVKASVKQKIGNTADTNKPSQTKAGVKKPRPSNTHANTLPQSSTDSTNTSPESKDLPTETYLCVLCKTYRATWKHGMLRHIAEEIEYFPFVCPHCPFSTNRQDTVRNHVKSEHPGLEVSVKFNKDEAKEQRALELLEKSVVVRNADMMGTKVDRNSDDSPGNSRGYKRKLLTDELGTVSPVRRKVRRPGPRTPGKATYWLGDEFQPSVALVDVMKMPSWELKRLLKRLRFTNLSILF